jgi:hypothetical protein
MSWARQSRQLERLGHGSTGGGDFPCVCISLPIDPGALAAPVGVAAAWAGNKIGEKLRGSPLWR